MEHGYLTRSRGKNGVYLYHPMHIAEPDAFDHLASLIARYAPGQPFTLVAVECENWGADYSPWPAMDFAGKGPETLARLRRQISSIEGEAPRERYIGGYSLAGLFALWAFCGTDLFSGAAACSASLWYPGWEEYRTQPLTREGTVYLSLGEKEERTRHPVMRRVGDAARLEAARLAADPMIWDSTLVMHPGGHGSQADVRMAQGFAWLLNHRR